MPGEDGDSLTSTSSDRLNGGQLEADSAELWLSSLPETGFQVSSRKTTGSILSEGSGDKSHFSSS